MRNFLLTLFALVSFLTPSFADGADYIHVVQLEGSDYVKALSTIGRIEFADNNVTVVDNTKDHNILFSCPIASAKKILFNNEGSSSTAIIPTQEESAVSIKAFPNPAAEYVTVTGLAEGETIRLFDLQGKAVKQTVETTVSLTGLPVGVYFLQAGQEVVKIIKNK